MNLQKCKYSFIRLTINKTKRYSELKKSGKNQFEFSNYLINTIWNKWNLFWRNYWIVMFISGGVDVNGNIILPPLKKSREKEINVLLTKIGWCSRNEPTWGSTSSIEAISTKLMICPNLILTSLPLYKRDIIAFQLVRNTYMHQTPENFRNLLDCLRPDFIDVNSRNLSDILDVKSMYTQKSLFESALDSMYALITGIP